jgi:hypothetical protein
MRLSALIIALFLAAPAAAAPTEIHVRLLSQGAKFVGTSMGGVEVTVKDVETGKTLTTGLVKGGTGDTARIMAGGPRGTAVSTPDAAVFKATLDLAEPRLLEVSARGPLSHPQSMVEVKSQRWVLPGRGVATADGWLMELPGLVVDAVEPPGTLARGATSQKLAVQVAMMCGCPITPGGIWDANGFDVQAIVKGPNAESRTVKLVYGGETGLFVGDVPLNLSGTYDVTLTAFDNKTGATGVDRARFVRP